MAEVVKPYKIGDYWTNLVDSSTGENVNYEEVTEWFDGTPMDDSKVDGGVYRKLPSSVGGGYVIKVYPDFGGIFLEKDSMSELRNLSQTEILLLKIGRYKGVKLNGYYTAGDTPAPIDYILSGSSVSGQDDGGSRIEIDDIVLVHNFHDYIHISYFGGSESVNNSPILLNALNCLPDFGGEVHFPEGSFSFEDSVIFPRASSTAIKNVIVSGNNPTNNHSSPSSVNSRGITLLIYTGVGNFFDLRDGTDSAVISSCNIRNLNMRYSGPDNTGTVGIRAGEFTRGSLKTISVHGFDKGITIHGFVYYSLFEEIYVSDCNEGITIVGLLNGTNLRRCRISQNNIGLILQSAGRSGSIDNCWIENNSRGVQISDTRQIGIISTYFENHLTETLHISGVETGATVNIINCSAAVDNGANRLISAGVNLPVNINFYGLQVANRSVNLTYLVQSAGGTASYLPTIFEQGTVWYDGNPVPTSPNVAWPRIAIQQDRVTIGGVDIISGQTVPLGNITAPTGSLYLRRLSTDLDSQLYIKASGGTSNTGWQRVSTLKSGNTASRPTSTYVGLQYFDTTLGHPIWYDGTNWVDATGATV